MGDPLRLGRYELAHRLGAGGMAEVFLARVDGPGGFRKSVVLKRMHARLTRSPELVQMFLAEARTAARFRHPNLVQIFDFGEVDGTYFLAMEHLEGADLHQLARAVYTAGRPVPPEVVAIIGAAICQGLDQVHNAADDDGRPLEIVHRDVSLANIFVTLQGEVKLLDFGVARSADREVHTQVGVLKGKYPYLSPEQARGQRLDGRSDLFSLGIVLHELASGVPLFHRTDGDVATLRAVLADEVPGIRAWRPDFPQALEAVILKALERDRARRFASAREMGAAFEAVLARLAPGQPATLLRGWIAGVALAPLAGQAVSSAVDTASGAFEPPTTRSEPSGEQAGGPPVEPPTEPSHDSVHDSPVHDPEPGPGVQSRGRALVLPVATFLLTAGVMVALGLGWSLFQPPRPGSGEVPGAEVFPATTPAQAPAPLPGEEKAASTAGSQRRRLGESQPREQEPAEATAASPALAPGSLIVTCNRPCEVRIDGEAVGRTPLGVISLAVGNHRVEARWPGAAEWQRQEVLIAPNRVRNLAFRVVEAPFRSGTEDW